MINIKYNISTNKNIFINQTSHFTKHISQFTTIKHLANTEKYEKNKKKLMWTSDYLMSYKSGH